jgi:hypothetical protein
MAILLTILAILIGVPLILIFTPVRYRVNAAVGDNNTFRLSVSYLLHFIHITINYSDKHLDSTIRIAGFKMKPRPEKEVKPKPATAKRVKREKPKAAKPDTDKPSADTPDTAKTEQDSVKTESDTAKTKPDSVKLKPEKKSLRERMDSLRTLLTRIDLKIIIDILIRYIKKTIKYLLPKRFTVKGVVGFNDPYHTGLLIGGIYAAAGALSKRQCLLIAGDFDKRALRLTVEAAGRVSLAGMLSPLIWLVSRKPVFKLLVEYLRQRKIKNKG